MNGARAVVAPDRHTRRQPYSEWSAARPHQSSTGVGSVQAYPTRIGRHHWLVCLSAVVHANDIPQMT